MNSRVTIIAEAGVNYNGDIGLARELVDVAAETGADYVKFQTFKAANLVTESAKKAEYQRLNMGEASGDSQWSMLKSLELTPAMHDALLSHCERRNIRFLSSAFE